MQYRTSTSMAESQRRLASERGSTVRRHRGTLRAGSRPAGVAPPASGSGDTTAAARALHRGACDAVAEEKRQRSASETGRLRRRRGRAARAFAPSAGLCASGVIEPSAARRLRRGGRPARLLCKRGFRHACAPRCGRNTCVRQRRRQLLLPVRALC